LNRFRAEGMSIFPAGVVGVRRRRTEAIAGRRRRTGGGATAPAKVGEAGSDRRGRRRARAHPSIGAAVAPAVAAAAAAEREGSSAKARTRAPSATAKPDPADAVAQAPATPAVAKAARGKPKRAAHPGIRATDSMAEAAFKTLRFHCERMLDNEAGTREGDDIEHLHDMRVATRRMRAALRVFGPYLDAKVMKPVERGLKRTGRTLGAVRDLDVFHEKTQRYLDALPDDRKDELEPLLDVWKARREHAREQMLDYLDGGRYRRFVDEFSALLDEGPARAGLAVVADDGEARPHRVAHVLPAVLYERLAAVWAYDDVITAPDTPLVRFHRLRIAGKFLRYTFEFYEEVLGSDAKALIKTTKEMQDHLGDLQDAVVSCTVLRDFLTWGAWEPPTGAARREPHMVVAPGVAAYLAYRQDELHRLVDTFPEVWPSISGEGYRRSVAEVVGAL
ncbi:MAG TPA: CHAD domain-containing protein, partial [Thermoleophilia bacterium]|nr:CHAD domain-containing protein [Thermoleophilia bacterium]